MFHVKRQGIAIGSKCDDIGEIVANELEESFPYLGLPDSTKRALPKIRKFATLLALWGQTTNLTAHPTDPNEIIFHVMDSLAPVALAIREPASTLGRSLRKGRRLLDFGSGAGFPGLIIATAVGIETVLLESRRKRASFLAVAASTLGLKYVSVTQSFKEPNSDSDRFDIVTARAVGKHREFFHLAAQALKPGGIAMLFLNIGQAVEADAGRAGLVELPAAVYDISRGDEKIRRVLGIWLKES